MASNEYKDIAGSGASQFASEEEIAMLGDLLEMPSQETVDKWAKAADERISKRARQKRFLALAAVIAIACVSMAMVVKGLPIPDAEAGLDDETDIEETMESETIYPSWDKLPDDIKEQFVEFKEFTAGYHVENVGVEEGKHIVKVIIKLGKNDGEEIYIRQMVTNEGSMDKYMILDGSDVDILSEKNIHIKKYENNLDSITYNFIYEGVGIDITIPYASDEIIVRTLIEKAIQ